GGSVEAGNAGGGGRGGAAGASGGAAGASAGQAGSGEIEAGSGGMSNDPNVGCTEGANATGTALERCSGFLRYTYGTRDVCLARTKVLCLAEMGASGTGATAQAERACAASFAGEACASLGASCARAGQLTDGAPCWTAWQCNGGACQIEAGQP